MPDSSTDFSPCRLDWRPSRVGASAGAALLVVAGLSPLLTRWADALPLAAQGALALAALAVAVGAYRRESRRPGGTLDLLPGGRARWSPAANASGVGDGGAARSAAVPAIDAEAQLHEQWPLTTVRLLPAGPTVLFWPDTLCDSGRRALRRWAGAAPDASPLSQFWMG